MRFVPTQLLVAAILAASLADCSSYLDDFFLPSAKLALNKIQQSLGGSARNLASEIPVIQTTTSEATATEDARTQTELNSPVESSVKLAEEPIAKVEASASSDSNRQTQTQTQTSSGSANSNPQDSAESSEDDSKVATVLSSTEASDQDPSSTVESAASSTDSKQAEESKESKETKESKESKETNEAKEAIEAKEAKEARDGKDAIESSTPAKTESWTRSSSEKSESSTRQTDDLGSAPIVVIESEPARPNSEKSKDSLDTVAASKEAQLEAVAAVDASIGFGDSLFGSLSDTCYDEYGNARYCEPEFENVAFERQIQVSSECGDPASKFCVNSGANSDDSTTANQVRSCHICDSQHTKKRHPAAFLTDLNNPAQPTCWVSAPIEADVEQAGQKPRTDNVSLVLNLDKKYEIAYLSMQFCSSKPDSLAIYKSNDYGRNWIPYQFFSSQCQRVYARAQGSEAQESSSEAGCTDWARLNYSRHPKFSSLLVWSPAMAGEPSDKTGSGQSDWSTATSLKVVLDRPQASGWIHGHAHEQTSKVSNESSSDESQLSKPSDSYNYALADLVVGARCKCNGHASRCVHSKTGQLQCDCRHNTAGRECERCAPFHFDRPWSKASQSDANPCQRK